VAILVIAGFARYVSLTSIGSPLLSPLDSPCQYGPQVVDHRLVLGRIRHIGDTAGNRSGTYLVVAVDAVAGVLRVRLVVVDGCA